MESAPKVVSVNRPCSYTGHQIITDLHEILLFSLCTKSTVIVFKMTKQLPEESEGGPFCQQGNYGCPER